MAGNSTLDPDNAPAASGTPVKGHDTRTLGPSDSSDSGSDLARPGTDRRLGDVGLDADSDRSGTGERMAADLEPEREDADLAVDRVVDASEAGLGGGLDQAEEAQRGITSDQDRRDDRRGGERDQGARRSGKRDERPR